MEVMRWMVIFAMVVLSARAYADPRIGQLITGYEKEAAACKIHADGIAKVLDGAKDLPDASADVDALAKTAAVNQDYCSALAAVLELLRADPNASYKSLEKQLDDYDNKIRKLRKASKQALDDAQPVISKLIPKINAHRIAATSNADKRKFPSGRAIDLPALPGTWKLSGTTATDVAAYAENAMSATVTTQPFGDGTCADQRKALAAKADRLDDVAPSDALKPLKPVWYVAYMQKGRVQQVACVTGKTGGWLATIDAPEGAKLPLGTVMARMLAVQIAP